MTTTIDVESSTVNAEPMALERRPDQAVGKAMSLEQLHERLEYIRNVMRQEMKEGQDYGKIPGTGDKPSLLQPGAQKLLMTFNLREQVKKEVLREIPHPTVPGHREYEFTVTVFPSGLRPEDGWDGIGTCSTFESKYRYRKAERKCPACGKPTIIKGKEEYGGGFLCWAKKGGCGQKFGDDDARITGQPADDVENEDPADQWNTVRKMAFKRALVSAAINATNTSELWTQDVEDMVQNQGRTKSQAQPRSQPSPSQAQPSSRVSTPPKAPPASPSPVSAPLQREAKPAIFADQATLDRMILALAPCGDLALEYFRKLNFPTVLLPEESGETLKDIPLQYVPVTTKQMRLLQAAITDFGNGAEAKHAFPPNPLPPDTKQKSNQPARPVEVPGDKTTEPASVETAKKRDPEWFWPIICPIPHKGEKKADYDRNPDTIKWLYDAMKSGDQDAQKRLWGFAKHWAPEPREHNGKTHPVSEADKVFREALDAFCDWEEKHGKDK